LTERRNYINTNINEIRLANKKTKKTKADCKQPVPSVSERQIIEEEKTVLYTPFHSLDVKPCDLAAFIRACKNGFTETIAPNSSNIQLLSKSSRKDLDGQENTSKGCITKFGVDF